MAAFGLLKRERDHEPPRRGRQRRREGLAARRSTFFDQAHGIGPLT